MADGISDLAKLYSATQPIESTLDFPVASSPLIPSTDFSNPLSALSLQLQEKARQLEDQKHQYERDALAASSLSGPEAITGSALAALPILVGLALKGKKGGAIGAQAGGLGSLNFFGNLQKEDEKKRLLAQSQLKQVQNQQADLTKQAFQLQTKGAEIKSRENEGELNRQNQRAIAEFRHSGEDASSSPILRQGVQKILEGKDPSPEELDAILANPKTATVGLRIAELKGIGDRFNKRIDRETLKGVLPGYEIGKGYLPPSPTTADNLKKKSGATDQAIFYLDQIKEIVQRGGASAINGVDPAILAQISGAIFNAKRIETGSGARLEGPEAKFLNAYIPETIGGKGLLAYTNSQIFKRDPALFIDRTKKLLEQARDVDLANYGLIRKEASYPKGFLESKKLQFPEVEQSSPLNLPIVSGADGKKYYRDDANKKLIPIP